MVWTVTLEVVDCASASTKLAGASVLDGTTNVTSVTDGNGRVPPYSKEDSLSQFNVKITLLGYIAKNAAFTKGDNGTVRTICLNASPVGTGDPNVPTGVGGDGGGCFIVSATTGSAESSEVDRLRQLRDRVATASELGGELIELIYCDYSQFAPGIAGALEQDTIARNAVLWGIVRPLLAWYRLVGVLAFEPADQQAAKQAARDVLDACPRFLGGSAIVPVLKAVRAGEPLPANTHPLLVDFAPRLQKAARLQFATWAILDPLVRAWQSATERLDLVDEAGQWLANAPLEALTPPSDRQRLDAELEVLASFFDFRPTARRQLGERLAAAWPGAAAALARAGFVSYTPTNE